MQKTTLYTLAAGISLISFATNATAFETKARNAILMDYETGTYLFTKEHQEMIAPASMSKLMTVYILMKKIKDGEVSLEDTFTVSQNAWRKGGAASGGSTMFLKIDQEVKVEDLLKGILIQSGNDACIVVAENVAGSEEEFAAMMNETAQKMGLKNAHFENATGLPHPDHRISPEDLAILARHIIQEFPEFYPIFKQKEFTYNGIKQGNRNPLLYTLKGADGLKTGHTDEAGYCLTASVERGDRRLIEVVTGLSSNKERSEESESLMTWGFANFENYKFFQKNQIVAEIPVWYGAIPTVEAIVPENVVRTAKKSTKDKYAAQIFYKTPLKAPINKGDKIGEIRITYGEKLKDTIPLVAKNDVAKMGFAGRFVENLKYFIFGEKK
ncbi:MAG: D-alanyl-D-alanine carboxypeptidase [Alphaproteobacteria bacterium]|nr:D-alanyl-D-alanine carboxypeptidase [Alphaproteobacteria bacterium]